MDSTIISEATVILAATFPDFDPIAVQIGPLAIRWYALSYIAGILLAWRYCRHLTKRPPGLITPLAFDDFMAWSVLGIVLGGRLGYVLFYKPLHYLQDPISALFIWEGGMSFHGGMLGVAVAMYLFARKRGIPYLALTDIVGAAVPLGLCLGRIANFINGELFGRATDIERVPWAMVFPHGGPAPRHPSQLYEAGLEGILLFIILYILVRKGALQWQGFLSGAFLLGYGTARFIVEFFREPDQGLSFAPSFFSMGQILSLPMMLLGAAVIIWALKHRVSTR